MLSQGEPSWCQAHLEGLGDVGGGRHVGYDKHLGRHGPVVLAHVALRALRDDVHAAPERVAPHVQHGHLGAPRREPRVRVVVHEVGALVPLPARRLDQRL